MCDHGLWMEDFPCALRAIEVKTSANEPPVWNSAIEEFRRLANTVITLGFPITICFLERPQDQEQPSLTRCCDRHHQDLCKSFYILLFQILQI